MPTLKGLESLVQLLPRHDPNDALIIPDANFLFDLENNHLWADNSYAKAKILVEEAHGKQLKWRIPRAIMSQYERAKENQEKDEFDIPLVNGILDDLMPDRGLVYSPFDSSAAGLTNIVLRYDPNLEKNEETGNIRFSLEELKNKITPGYADEQLIFTVFGYAIQNTEVYVASRDYKDITNRLLKWSEVFGLNNLDINILHRSPVEMEYMRKLDGTPFILTATFTGAAIKGLLEAVERSGYYHVVIFEKKVKSGDAIFDVGVGIAEKQWFRPFELPKGFDSIKENYKIIPALVVNEFQYRSNKDWKRVRDRVYATNSREVALIDRKRPFKPNIFSRKGNDLIRTEQFRTDLGFLFYNSDSKFAQANYVPFN